MLVLKILLPIPAFVAAATNTALNHPEILIQLAAQSWKFLTEKKRKPLSNSDSSSVPDSEMSRYITLCDFRGKIATECHLPASLPAQWKLDKKFY